MVRSQANILRIVTRDRFQRGMLQIELGRGMCERWILQLHTSERTECGLGQGDGVVDEEVAEAEGKG